MPQPRYFQPNTSINQAISPPPYSQAISPPPSYTVTTSDAVIIQQALSLLGKIQNLPQDEAYMQHMGLTPGFHNGQDALKTIQNNNINVAFGDMGDSKAHAQWMADQKRIMINARYRGDASPATLYAISEAIYHEAGHAAQMAINPYTGQRQNLSLSGFQPAILGDDQSSIQEELNCLALNTLAHRYHEAIDPAYAQASSSSPLLRDGVQLYSRLFFDPDPYKKALINRVVEKYGELPMSSPGHEPPPPMEPVTPLPLAYRVAQQVKKQSALESGINNSVAQRLAYWA